MSRVMPQTTNRVLRPIVVSNTMRWQGSINFSMILHHDVDYNSNRTGWPQQTEYPRISVHTQEKAQDHSSSSKKEETERERGRW
mmetsp:Transcript_23780/g.66421  ORF Transcript_23780/g.66421 Transcript_23780/m.66421 type:complete len:84 (+) Transcript_23780:80-331(+)